MSNVMQQTIRTILRGALGMVPVSEITNCLEDRLFSEILAASDAGEVPKEAFDVMSELYSQLADKECAQLDTLTLALHRLFSITGIPEVDPEGAIGFAIKQVLVRGRVTGADALRFAEFPWAAAARDVSGPTSNQLTRFAELLAALSHDVEERFAEPAAEDADLYEEAKTLWSLLEPVIVRNPAGVQGTAYIIPDNSN